MFCGILWKCWKEFESAGSIAEYIFINLFVNSSSKCIAEYFESAGSIAEYILINLFGNSSSKCIAEYFESVEGNLRVPGVLQSTF